MPCLKLLTIEARTVFLLLLSYFYLPHFELRECLGHLPDVLPVSLLVGLLFEVLGRPQLLVAVPLGLLYVPFMLGLDALLMLPLIPLRNN